VRRVVRALEVCLVTGKPMSRLRSRQSPPYRVIQIGLTMPREDLYERADRRVDAMISRGLEQEVRRLVDAGFGFDLPALSGLGYAQFRAYLEGKATLDEAVADVRRATHSFIRRQYNWFRLSDPTIRWFDVTTTTADEIEVEVRFWLGRPRQA
jgi:tRNA dimethylallyltransferase